MVSNRRAWSERNQIWMELGQPVSDGTLIPQAATVALKSGHWREYMMLKEVAQMTQCHLEG
jgi:hypothetical protein